MSPRDGKKGCGIGFSVCARILAVAFSCFLASVLSCLSVHRLESYFSTSQCVSAIVASVSFSPVRWRC